MSIYTRAIQSAQVYSVRFQVHMLVIPRKNEKKKEILIFRVQGITKQLVEGLSTLTRCVSE